MSFNPRTFKIIFLAFTLRLMHYTCLVSAEFFYFMCTSRKVATTTRIQLFMMKNIIFFAILKPPIFLLLLTILSSHCCVINIIHEILLQGQGILFCSAYKHIFIHNDIYVACSFQIVRTLASRVLISLPTLPHIYLNWKYENSPSCVFLCLLACSLLKGQHWKVLKKWNLICTEWKNINFSHLAHHHIFRRAQNLLHRKKFSFLLPFVVYIAYKNVM